MSTGERRLVSARRWPGLKWTLRLAFCGVVAAFVWTRFIIPDRAEALYRHAEEEHRNGRYENAVQELLRAARLRDGDPRIDALLGSSYLELRQPREAEPFLARAFRADPSSERVKRAFADASLALHNGAAALPLLQELSAKHPGEHNLVLDLAEAYIKSGENLKAAQIYREMAERDPSDPQARQSFAALYGYAAYKADAPFNLPAPQRPSQLQVNFRAHGESLQVRHGRETGDVWRDLYVMGVNIGPARPGEFPSTASRDFATYSEWLRDVARMNANTVRVYTALPPAFYHALKAHNESASSSLWLIQEVWIDDRVQDLYDAESERMFVEDLKSTIDLLHGRADLPFRLGRNYGIYTADVSQYVLAVAVGREIEPRLAQATNHRNASHTAFRGQYVSLPTGTPTEAWFARMCDLAASYESQIYNTQRPLTVVNWPPLDPLVHPTETPFAEEVGIRRRLGENILLSAPQFTNDADGTSLDIVKFRSGPDFQAGLFALYHVYQHWPDFMLHESSFAHARDAHGPNRYLGYLQALKKAHSNVPLLIGEYGVANSLAAAHLHPDGWGNGGLNETQQAELLVRFTRNIRDTGCAGGLVFEWIDEWFKQVHDNYTADYEMPRDRDPLWFNVLDPEENFGIHGFEPAETVPLLRGESADWLRAEQLHAMSTPAAGQPGDLRAVYAMADFAYLYLRLDVRPGSLDWTRLNYWIALNTLPGNSGSKFLPHVDVRIKGGANFVAHLRRPTSSRILIAENYNPNPRMPVVGRPGEARVWRRPGMKIELADAAGFEEIRTEANQPRYGRDGRFFPALELNRSPLPYGSADRSSPMYSSHALWHADPDKGMIEVRIPWGLLLLTDPSDPRAIAGTDQQGVPQSRAVTAMSIAVLALDVPSNRVRVTLPPISDGLEISPLTFSWKKWDRIQFRMYAKESYHALRRTFGEIAGRRLATRARR